MKSQSRGPIIEENIVNFWHLKGVDWGLYSDDGGHNMSEGERSRFS